MGYRLLSPKADRGNNVLVTLKEGVLVFSGYHNTIPETRWPKQHLFSYSSRGRRSHIEVPRVQFLERGPF